MPSWLRAIARFNPLPHLVDALRGLMLPGDVAFATWGVDVGVLALIFAPLLVVTVRPYRDRFDEVQHRASLF